MSLSDEYLSIDTPENVIFGYEVAGIGSRFLAAFIDTVFLSLLQGLVYFIFALFLSASSGSLSRQNQFGLLVVVFGLISFGFLWGYYIFFELIWNGQSPGKYFFNLRVIRTDGTPITITESIIRNLIRIIDFLPFYYGIGVVTMFINTQSRRLGDLAAGTLVVFDHGEITLEQLTLSNELNTFSKVKISPETRALPLERLTEQDLQLAINFLNRRNEMTNSTELALHLLDTFFARMEQAPPEIDWWKAASFLQEIVQAAQEREAK